MKAVFIGAGNVATHLATGLYNHNVEIIQVFSRTIGAAQSLAQKVGAAYTNCIEDIFDGADVYVFSVKDSVLDELIAKTPANNGLWLHTAGSMPMDIFAARVTSYGVLYPFQTFSKGRNVNWREIPLFIEGNNEESTKALQSVASLLSGKVMELPSAQRRYVHLAGVFACNFANHMYTLSGRMLQQAGLPFDIALPLIGETCAKVHQLSPYDAQTGPAVRLDKNVIDKHLSLIGDDDVEKLYKLISESIHKTHSS